jgi:hypothetical protein
VELHDDPVSGTRIDVRCLIDQPPAAGDVERTCQSDHDAAVGPPVGGDGQRVRQV